MGKIYRIIAELNVRIGYLPILTFNYSANYCSINLSYGYVKTYHDLLHNSKFLQREKILGIVT